MKLLVMARSAGIAALITLIAANAALARNPHCSGGILYVTQAIRDKDKGDMESYERQMRKAVTELEVRTAQDPADFEALGYLGWAYAELDRLMARGAGFLGSRYAIMGAAKSWVSERHLVAALSNGGVFGVIAYLRNKGDGTFEDIAAALATDKRSYAMGVGIDDLNGDDRPDIYISNIVVMDKDQK